MRRSIVLFTAAVTASMGLVVVGGAARATFPGAEGRIAFLTDRSGCCDISTMNPNGTQVSRLTNVAPDAGAFDPFWSPDHTTIVYDQGRNGPRPNQQIWVMNADGSDQHRLLPDPFFVDYFPSYSPDGRWIAFNRCQPDFGACAIYRMHANGSGLSAVTPFKASVSDLYPRYSPDGRTLAFWGMGRGGVAHAIYLADANGSNVRRLTPPSKLRAFTPDWSPNGSRIVFVGQRFADAPTAIWTINIGNGKLHRLTSPGESFDLVPSYAPSGDKVAFERDSADFSKFSVWVVNPDGSGATKVRGNHDGQPVWGSAPLTAAPRVDDTGSTASSRTTRASAVERTASCADRERLAGLPPLRSFGSCSR
jgi:Tol biopolymer transport system component